MSIMGMRRKFAKHLKIIMWVVIAVFVIGIPLASYYFGRPLPEAEGGAARSGGQGEVIATIGTQSLTRAQLDDSYQNALQQEVNRYGQKVSLDFVLQLRNQALMQAASNLVLNEAARKAGVNLSRSEIKQSLDQQAVQFADQLKQVAERQGKDPREIYRGFMEKQGTSRSRVSEEDFRNWLKKSFLAPHREELESALLTDKFRKSIISQVQVNDADLQAAFDETKLGLILVSTIKPKRSEAEAKQKVEGIYASLQKGGDFAALAKSQSDADSAMFAKDWISRANLRTMLGEEAEKALFTLAPGKFTAPLKLPQGYVLLQLLEKRSNLPADFAKNKEELRKKYLASRQQESWDKVMQDNLGKMALSPKDPEIAALKDLQEGKLKEAGANFEKAIEDIPGQMPGEVYSAICLYLAQSYFNAKDMVEAQKKLDAALAPPREINRELVAGYPEELYLLIGQLALEQNQKPEALENFSQADNNANENPRVHVKLKQIYEQMGEKEKAKQQEQWLQEFAQYHQQLQQRAKQAAPTNPKNEPPDPAEAPAAQK